MNQTAHRFLPAILSLAALLLSGCNPHDFGNALPAPASATTAPLPSSQSPRPPASLGFDRNDYPGDAALPALRQHFAFTSFWLNNPPGESANSWAGHRSQLRTAGFGFVVLWNGRLDAEIKRALTRDHLEPGPLGAADARAAIAAARREGFPDGTLLFLDQEEGGRLLPEQSAYFFGFTEALASSVYRAGAYLSGQPADDGPGAHGKRITITTAQDVRETIAQKHLQPVALWVSEDACPPAPGCTVDPAALNGLSPRSSGTPEAIVWQYAQSPQRPELTRACAASYARDGNCHAGSTPALFLDLNLASSPDPSHGR